MLASLTLFQPSTKPGELHMGPGKSSLATPAFVLALRTISRTSHTIQIEDPGELQMGPG